jgi:hypothetical protein
LPAAPFPAELLRWIRGDLPDAEFESWLYASETAEKALGAHAYHQELIELDYRDRYATENARQRLVDPIARACWWR